MMEDSGIDSGDTRPLQEIASSSTSSLDDEPIMQAPRSQVVTFRRLTPGVRNKEYKKPSGSLLPLQRLPYPGSKETQPLVEWESDDSTSETVTFFPGTDSNLRQSSPPSDLLLVEELTTSDEDEADDLELVITDDPPSNCCLVAMKFCFL